MKRFRFDIANLFAIRNEQEPFVGQVIINEGGIIGAYTGNKLMITPYSVQLYQLIFWYIPPKKYEDKND